jgi:hypothetical protein
MILEFWVFTMWCLCSWLKGLDHTIIRAQSLWTIRSEPTPILVWHTINSSYYPTAAGGRVLLIMDAYDNVVYYYHCRRWYNIAHR